MGVRGSDGSYREHAGSVLPSSAWPQGQVVAAALDLAQLDGNWRDANASIDATEGFWSGDAYAPNRLWVPGVSRKLWDDNAWIGLDLMQAFAQSGDRRYVERAERMWPFFERGLAPEGGVKWRERDDPYTLNTCANAPTIQLALRLYEATGKKRYLDVARQLDVYLQSSLRRDDGLFRDHIDANGKRDEHVYTYNQGAAIGADLLWARTTGDRAYIDRARDAADAVLKRFSGDSAADERLWKQSPAFNAILMRHLLALDAEGVGNGRYRAFVERYADRLWGEGRDERTGLFTAGGIGEYHRDGSMDTLDQAGVVQIFALLKWPREQLDQVG